MKKCLITLLPIIDFLLFLFVIPAALIMKFIRMVRISRMPLCRKVLLKVGVFPIRNHYYEPQFIFPDNSPDFSAARQLPGINWNDEDQLKMLENFTYSDELKDLPKEKTNKVEYYLANGNFVAGDSEYWYQLIRHLKPARIYEIGSGYSTLMARRALDACKRENAEYNCDHVCIEPYEMPWLEGAGVKVHRKKVEDVELDFFKALEADDILFIDSSHMIRPHGDVLFEFLTLLPTINPGVIVHVHDIFTPANYSKKWIVDEVKFWNEQYLLEAFLTQNREWQVVGGLNYLYHNHREALKEVAPNLSPELAPTSFYMKRIQTS